MYVTILNQIYNKSIKQNREIILSFGLSFTVVANQITNLSNMS